VENNQYKLCVEVLKRLDEADVLKDIVIIGSWCIPFYKGYFAKERYVTSIKTRDIDFLVRKPAKIKAHIDLPEMLKDLGFIVGFKGEVGVIKLEHPDLVVEFLVPEIGKGSDKPYPLPQLGLNAQRLRFLNFLTANTIEVKVGNVTVILPHPANFALHKLIVSQRRKTGDKTVKDRDSAIKILNALIEKGEELTIRKVFNSVPQGWRKKVLKGLELAGETKIIRILTL
jgi:hypothetical protein